MGFKIKQSEFLNNPQELESMLRVVIGFDTKEEVQQIVEVLALHVQEELKKELLPFAVEEIKMRMPEIVKTVERELVVKGLQKLMSEDD